MALNPKRKKGHGGAPKGNQNAAKGSMWRNAILRALERRTASRKDGIDELDALAEKLLELVAAGEIQSIKELGDRLDGKPPQSIQGPDGEAVPIRLVING